LHLGAKLQTVAGGFDFFRARQFANGRFDDVECLAGLERDFDLPPLAIGKRAGVGAAGDHADAAQVRGGGGDDKYQRHQRAREQRPGQLAIADDVPQDDDEDKCREPGEDEAEVEEEAGFHVGGARGS